MLQWDMNYRVGLEQQTPKRDLKKSHFWQDERRVKNVKWTEELKESTKEQAWRLKSEITAPVQDQNPYETP